MWDIIQTMYTVCLYLLIDGDKISEEAAPNKGLKQGCPLSPLLYSLYTNDIDRFLTVQRGAATALDSVQVPHCDYADDISLTSNTAECLQFQLNNFHNYTRFNSHGLLQLGYFCDPHLHVRWHTSRTCHSFQIPWITSHSWWKYNTAAETMADNLRLAVARVYRTGSSKGITHRKHAMLWLFQVFALTAGLYGCQVWATFSLTYDSSVTTRAHVLHLGFLKKLLGVKKGTDTHCARAPRNRPDAHLFLLVQMHHKILEQFTLFKQPSSRKNCAGWFTSCKQKWYMDLPGSACAPRSPTSQQFLDAIRYRQTINLGQFELTLREHTIGGWRDDILTPHEAHHSSRIMRTYHTHFGEPLGNTPGWWDDRKRNQKPVMPFYLRLDIPSNLSRALSCLRLSGHNFLVQRMRHDRNRRPYELRICDRCD